jgi:hypothetical protein
MFYEKFKEKSTEKVFLFFKFLKNQNNFDNS